jgi:hypothetical protein
MARIVALAYNWWNIYVCLVHPDRHMEAITSRPLLLHAIARKTRHAGRITALDIARRGSVGGPPRLPRLPASSTASRELRSS